MGSNWGYIPLGELISLQRGHDLPSQNRINGSIPIMGSSGITGFHNEVKCSGPGVVVGRSGDSMGVVSYIDRDYWPLNTCLYITDFKGNDVRYIYYLLQQINFDQFNSGSAQKSLNRNAVYPYEVYATKDKSLQKKIGEFIFRFEDKITLNRQINQTLEQMTQTLFRSWFVDFDPVIDNALDAGNDIPDTLQERAEQRRLLRAEADFKPLPAETRALFPSEFEETELGWVPKGWELLPISEAIVINPSVKLAKGSSAKFADMKALPTTGYAIEGIELKLYAGGAKFQKNDVLLARITPCLENGKTGFVDFLNEDEVGFGSTEFIVMRQTEKVHFGYVACLARNTHFRAHAVQSMVGSSGRQRVQNSCFDDYTIVVPPPSIMTVFAELSEATFSKTKNNNLEIAALNQLRDNLLPKLISGELELDDLPEVPELAEAR